MKDTPLKPFFHKTAQSEIKNLINRGFKNFQSLEININQEEYLFEKISNSYIGFFTYQIDNQFNCYFLPIAIFNEKGEAGVYPLYEHYLSANSHLSSLIFKSVGGTKTKLLATISSLSTLNEIYDILDELRNGHTAEMSSDSITFKVTDLFNASINFHTSNGKSHIATMNYNYNEIEDEVTFEKIEFLGEYKEVGQNLLDYHFSICNNLIDDE